MQNDRRREDGEDQERLQGQDVLLLRPRMQEGL